MKSQILKQRLTELGGNKNKQTAAETLQKLQSAINTFFDRVGVNTPISKYNENDFNLLNQLIEALLDPSVEQDILNSKDNNIIQTYNSLKTNAQHLQAAINTVLQSPDEIEITKNTPLPEVNNVFFSIIQQNANNKQLYGYLQSFADKYGQFTDFTKYTWGDLKQLASIFNKTLGTDIYVNVDDSLNNVSPNPEVIEDPFNGNIEQAQKAVNALANILSQSPDAEILKTLLTSAYTNDRKVFNDIYNHFTNTVVNQSINRFEK